MEENKFDFQSLTAQTNSIVRSGLGLGKETQSQSDQGKMSAMEEQWEFFVATAKDKAESHTMASRFWGSVDTFFGLSLIFLSASTTALALLDGVPKEVVAGVGAVSTMLAAASSFLKSSDRRQLHEKTSKNFRSLMVKMISCELENDYEKLWADFNREVMDEPIMLAKFTKKFRMKFTMSPELREVVEEKELVIAQLENQKNQELLAAAEAAAAAAEQESDETSKMCKSPNKEKWKSIIEIPDIGSLPNGILKKKKTEFHEPLV